MHIPRLLNLRPNTTYISLRRDQSQNTAFVFSMSTSTRAVIYTAAEKTPIVVQVAGTFKQLNKEGKLKPVEFDGSAGYTSATVFIKEELKDVFKKFAACQNTIALTPGQICIQSVPILTYRAWAWHSILLQCDTATKEKLHTIWGAGKLPTDSISSDTMVNLKRVPYSTDSLSGIACLSTASTLGSYTGGNVTSHEMTFDDPGYEPFEGYANLYSLITDQTHLSVSGATVASSMGSAAHLAAELLFATPARTQRRRRADNRTENTDTNKMQKMVGAAAPLAAECGHVLAQHVRKTHTGAYVGSNMPFVLPHVLRDGECFVAFPDALFKGVSRSIQYVSVELKTRWRAGGAFSDTDPTFKRGYAQTMLQGIAVFLHFKRPVTAAMAVAEIPKKPWVKKIKCGMVEKLIDKTIAAEKYKMLLSYVADATANSRRPNTFVDNYAAIPVTSPVYKDVLLNNKSIYVCSNFNQRQEATWTLFTPLNNGPGEPTTVDQRIPFTNYPANAHHHGAVLISCSLYNNGQRRSARHGVTLSTPRRYKFNWACQTVKGARDFVKVLKNLTDRAGNAAFSDVRQPTKTARVHAIGSVDYFPLKVFDLENAQMYVPDPEVPFRKKAWHKSGVDSANFLVWFPDLFQLQNAAE